MLRRAFLSAGAAVGVNLMMQGHSFGQTDASATPSTSGQTLDMVITRTFDSPVERVWQAWTDADYVKRWWGPEGYTAPVAEMDVRVGGTSLVCMRSPEGQDLYNTWTYETVEPNELLEFVHHFADKDGNPINPADVGLPPEIPAAVRHIIAFKPLSDTRTELTVTEQGYTVDWIVDLSEAGMQQCLDKMAAIFAEPGQGATPLA